MVTQKNSFEDDFKYIYSEMLEFAKGYYQFDDKEQRKNFIENQPQFSTFCRIPSTLRDEGFIAIGDKANKRFYEIAKKLIKPTKKKIKRDYSEQQVVDVLKLNFSKIIIDKHIEVDANTSRKIIDVTLNDLSKVNTPSTHYIPIQFFHDFIDEEFNLSRLKVISISRFKDEYIKKLKIRSPLESDLELDSYLTKNNAVIAVNIPACESSIAKKRALIAAKTLLGIFKLYSDRENTFNISVDTSEHICGKRLELIQYSDTLNITYNYSFGGAHVDNWRKLINNPTTDVNRIYSSVIDSILEPKPYETLGNRIVDAIYWISSATRDQCIYSRILKYITAIERLTTISSDTISRSVSERGSKLISIYEGNRDNWREKIDNIYKLRSEISHGSFSISGETFPISDKKAEEIAKKITISSSIFFSNLDINSDMSESKLANMYAKLESLPDFDQL